MLQLLLLLTSLIASMAFVPSPLGTVPKTSSHQPPLPINNIHYNSHIRSKGMPTLFMTNDEQDPNETVARRIIVTGDVDGGYYRTCVINEARRFRKLSGTMSPPDGGKRAEIYVEGKRKQAESFIRWCKRGDVGLSQSIEVEDVVEEFPTGLYDDFYVDTGRGVEKTS